VSRDSRSPQALAECSLQYTTSLNSETSAVIKAAPGILYGVRILSSAAPGTDAWIQIFDAVALPADGTVPDYRIAFPSTAVEVFDDFPRGMLFATGIVIGVSTTLDDLTTGTLPAAAESFFQAFFI
jgi:hypothetical protein